MWKFFRSWRHAERGFGMAALTILAMPLLVAAFGLGFESVRLVYIKDWMQGNADLATGAAVSIAYADPASQRVYLGTPGLGAAASTSTANAVYLENTSGKRTAPGTTNGLIYTASGGFGVPSTVITGSPLTRTQLCASPSTVKYGVQMTVTEKVPATFLNIVGIHDFTLGPITSTAIIRAGNC